MGKQLKSLTSALTTFIQNQKMFFVGTAPQEGKVNVSPKGMDTFKVLDNNRAIWLNLTGSGNETAAHVLENSRITIMFCAFEGSPLILRLYGTAKAIHEGEKDWDELIKHFPPIIGARQIFDINIEMVQTSCGFAVPLYDYKEERTLLTDWANKKGEEGLKEYHQVRNKVSLDGKPTGI